MHKEPQPHILLAKKKLGSELSMARKIKEISKLSIQENGCPYFQLTCIEKSKSNYTIDPLLALVDALGMELVLKVKTEEVNEDRL